MTFQLASVDNGGLGWRYGAMDPNTGVILEGTEEGIKQMEKDLGRELAPIPKEEMTKVRAMSMDDRKAYAKRILARRRKNKAAKASKKKNRK
jgi:hypothetical protein